jgi:hypothetical protein
VNGFLVQCSAAIVSPDPNGQALDRVREILHEILARVERLVDANGWR